jgi:hypothetical protein
MASRYRVTWLIDVHAESTKQACQIAQEVQRSRDNTACVYRATCDETPGELISLTMDDDQVSNYHCYITPLVGCDSK